MIYTCYDFDKAPAFMERLSLCAWCLTSFMKIRPKQHACTHQCNSRHNMRRLRAERRLLRSSQP